MKNIMKKTVCAIILISAAVLACSRNVFDFNNDDKNSLHAVFDKDGYWITPTFRVKMEKDGQMAYYGSNSLYGAYLAGRVAHLRHDFDTAAEYYKIVLEKDTKNPDITRYTYVILTSLGDLNAAAAYAQKEIDSGNKNSLAPLIVAIKDFSDENYAKSRKTITLLNKQDVYKSIINPLFVAWTYAGEKNEKAAINSLKKIEKDKSLETLKLFHQGMIYDYLGNSTKAAESYAEIIKNHPREVTYRVLEIITDFYARHDNKEMAQQIYKRYSDDSSLSFLLSNINNQMENTTSESAAIIDSPQKGLAEALFNIGTIFRVSNGGSEFAQIYISASSFLNPDYEISQIALANILEENGLYKEANRHYAQINKDSGSYFIAQLKMIENLNTLQDYKTAEKLLRNLLKEYPENTQLLNNLADIERETNQTEEAIKLYKQALATQKQPDVNSWPIYYALGASYYKNNQFKQAEEALNKALELSNRNPNVLNYLGYMYLMSDKNTDAAVQMILEAYKQYYYEGHIIDSMGWVHFRLGKYNDAIAYLEEAADMNPANAVICDHLGDAYWFAGRKNEALFQWQHALVLKEDADSIDREEIQNKIDNGVVKNKILTITNPEIIKELNSLNSEYDKQ